jgi:hypothetical protein
MKLCDQNTKFLILLSMATVLIIGIVSTTNPALAGTENKTSVQPQGTNGLATDSSNVILVHGGWADVFETS